MGPLHSTVIYTVIYIEKHLGIIQPHIYNQVLIEGSEDKSVETTT